MKDTHYLSHPIVQVTTTGISGATLSSGAIFMLLHLENIPAKAARLAADAYMRPQLASRMCVVR